MSSDPRQKLADRQAGLIRALKMGEQAPTGFDSEALAIAADSLRRKRARAAAKSWPALAAALDHQFEPLFERYAAEHPVPKENSAEDGLRFARWLDRAAQLPDRGRFELAMWQVSRGLPVRILRFRESAQIALVWRWQGQPRALQLPIPGGRGSRRTARL